MIDYVFAWMLTLDTFWLQVMWLSSLLIPSVMLVFRGRK